MIGLAILAASNRTHAASPVELGSPLFHPSLAQPIGWRGDGSGRYPAATPVLEWSATKNVRWSAVVGRGYASSIVADDAVLVTVEPNRLLCLDRHTGHERWHVDTAAADLTDEASRTAAAKYRPPKDGSGFAAATPLTDGRNVYVVFANGIVRAVGLDGRTAWIAWIEAEQSTGYGRSSSPVIVDGKLFVHMTNLYAYDPASGKRLWVNSDAKSNYGTPTGLKIGAVQTIVTSAGDVIRTDDGKTLDSGIGQSGHASPVVKDDVVYYGDTQISAVRLSAAFKDKEVWNAMLTNDVISSPLLHDGVFYTNTVKGELSAFDIASKGSADPLIEARPLFGGGEGDGPSVYSSLTLAGKYMFIGSNDGDYVVLEATRAAKQVAKNSLPAGNGASPFFSGGDMFLRSGDKLYCIGGP
jgi:outer membrane protein assembly factor BamB